MPASVMPFRIRHELMRQQTRLRRCNAVALVWHEAPSKCSRTQPTFEETKAMPGKCRADTGVPDFAKQSVSQSHSGQRAPACCRRSAPSAWTPPRSGTGPWTTLRRRRRPTPPCWSPSACPSPSTGPPRSRPPQLPPPPSSTPASQRISPLPAAPAATPQELRQVPWQCMPD